MTPSPPEELNRGIMLQAAGRGRRKFLFLDAEVPVRGGSVRSPDGAERIDW